MTKESLLEELARPMKSRLFQYTEQMARLGSWIMLPDTGEIFLSDNIYRLFGLEPGSVSPSPMAFRPFIYPEDLDRVSSRVEAVFQTGNSDTIEYRIMHRDGGVRFLRGKISMMVLPEGDRYFIGTTQDVTTEVQVRQELEMLSDTILDRVMVIDRNYCLTAWNKRCEETYRHTREEVLGKTLFSVFPKIKIPQIEDCLARALGGEFVHVKDFKSLESDGYLDFLMVPFEAPDRPRHVMIVLHDVTAEYRLREQLTERTRFAEMLIDSSVDRIVAFDKEMRFTAWNKMSETVYGLSKEAVLGRPVQDLFPQSEATAAMMEAARRALAGERVYVPAEPGLYTELYNELFFIPILDENEVSGLLLIAHDVTDRIRAEERLQAMNISLEQKNREMERTNAELASFAYVASHDLKEPLRKIQTFSKRLLQSESGNLSANGQEEFKRLLSAVHRMDALIEDILAFSRLNTGDQTATTLDLNELLEQIRHDLSEAIVRSGAQIEADRLPVVRANATQLYQLFLNLIGNALKFQPSGQRPLVEIRSEWLEEAPAGLSSPGPYLKLSFTDNGIGFEPAYAEKIFQMFQRLHGKGEYGGTGIGLSICKKVVENYGGMIRAESKPGEGSTFTCFLCFPPAPK